MKTKIKILKVRDGSFDGRDGELVEYYWVKATRIADDVSFEFGTKNGRYKIGDEVEPELEKSEDSKGGYRYKEVSN